MLHSGAPYFLSYLSMIFQNMSNFCNLYVDDTMIEKSGKTLDEIIPYIQSEIDICLTGSTLTYPQSTMISLAVCLLVLLKVLRNLRIASTLDLLVLAAP